MQFKTSTFGSWSKSLIGSHGNIGGSGGGYEGTTKPPIQPSALSTNKTNTADRFSTTTRPLVNLSGSSTK